VRACAHHRRRRQRAAAYKHPQPPEKRLCVWVEQVVTPGDGVAQGLLASGQIARSAGKEWQPLVEPRQQRLGGEDADARRRQLQRQRQPVQARADLSNCCRVVRCQGEAGLCRLRPLDEERHGRHCRQRRHVGHLSWLGQRQGRHDVLALARHP
jgi:hypothetical protein